MYIYIFIGKRLNIGHIVLFDLALFLKSKIQGHITNFISLFLKMHFNVLFLNIFCRVIAQNAQKPSGSPYNIWTP